eukprot:3034645-Prymnesium_polylepis.1
MLRDLVLGHCGGLHLLASRHDRRHTARHVVFRIKLAARAEAPRRAADGQDAAARGIVAREHALALRHGRQARLVAIITCGEAAVTHR